MSIHEVQEILITSLKFQCSNIQTLTISVKNEQGIVFKLTLLNEKDPIPIMLSES